MRESRFIEQNKHKWIELEDMLVRKDYDADRMSELFVQVSDDLSYARTFYPNRSVKVYLNHLTQQVYALLYRYRKQRGNQFFRFWTHDLPLAYWDCRREMRLSLIIFTLACLIGAFSQAYDDQFVRSILGDSYVDMTLANIADGDPMKVYKDEDAFGMFLRITLNNTLVALFTFFTGLLAGIGSVGALLSNGVMLGSFQYFFFQQGVGTESVLTIWIHGTIEIASIVVAGGAGLAMGKGLLFPDTLSRMQAFRLSARQGLKLFLGTVPLFIIAGFNESYLTRQTEIPNAIRAAFILLNVSFVVGYYVLLPWRRRHLAGLDKRALRLSPDPSNDIDYHSIKETTAIYSDGITVVRKAWSSLVQAAGISLLAFMLLMVGFFYFMPDVYTSLFTPDPETGVSSILEIFDWFNEQEEDKLYYYRMAGYAFVLLLPLRAIWRTIAIDAEEEVPRVTIGGFLFDMVTLAPIALLMAFCWANADLSLSGVWKGFTNGYLYLFCLAAPMAFYIVYAAFAYRMFWFATLPDIGKQLFKGYLTGCAMSYLSYLTGFILSSVMGSIAVSWFLNFISHNINFSPINLMAFNQALGFVIDATVLIATTSLLAAGLAVSFYSRREAVNAHGLLDRIEQVGEAKRIQGLRRE